MKQVDRRTYVQRAIGLDPTRWRDCFADRRIFNVHHLVYGDVHSTRKSAPHAHDFAEVFWINRGACEHAVNHVTHTVRAGQLCMVRPQRDTHALRMLPGALDFYNVAFPSQILRDLCGRYPDIKTLWLPRTPAPTVIQLTESELQWLAGAADALLAAPQDRMLLDRFLISLMCSIRQGQSDPWRACPAWLREAACEARRPENLMAGIPAFLKRCRRSPAHVARTLKKHTGLTPSEVINHARLEHAAARLTGTADDIQAIALDCGFDSLSYFYRLFHRHYGATPRHYRHDHCSIPARLGL